VTHPRVEESPVDAGFDSTSERALGIVARRNAPHFFVIDRRLNVVLRSRDIAAGPLNPSLAGIITRRLRQDPRLHAGTVLEPLDKETVVRIVPLDENWPDHFAVFIERVKHRGSLTAVGARYHLSKRELEVLALIVRSLTTAEIAHRLCISQGTVGDHVKSLLRKTKTTRRSELIGRIYGLESDGGTEGRHERDSRAKDAIRC
jgi:DNA-binding CsgD family transcriptional regulator